MNLDTDVLQTIEFMLSFPEKDCYETLGVDPSAPPEVIDAAWRALSKKFHPDLRAQAGTGSGRSVDEERQKEINRAYECLKTPERRKAYDDWQRERKPQVAGNPVVYPPSRPEAELVAYRRYRFWPGVIVGGAFGYFLHSVLLPGKPRAAVETVAYLLAAVMVAGAGAKRAGWAGGLSGLIVSYAVLRPLQIVSPSAFSDFTWAAIFGSLVSISAGWLLSAKRAGTKSAAISVTACAVMLGAGALGGGILLEARRGKPNITATAGKAGGCSAATLAAVCVPANATAIPASASGNMTLPARAVPGKPQAVLAANVWLPSGTTVEVVTIDPIAADSSRAGDVLLGALGAPIVVGGRVAVPQGESIYLRVVEIHSAQRPNRSGELRLALDQLDYRDAAFPLVSSSVRFTSPPSEQMRVAPGSKLEFQLLAPVAMASAP